MLLAAGSRPERCFRSPRVASLPPLPRQSVPVNNRGSLEAFFRPLRFAGLAVVVCPLISLMQNQVAVFETKHRVKAACLSSQTKEAERKYVEAQLDHGCPELRLLYVTPEQLSRNFKLIGDLHKLCSVGKLVLLAIDEAHCVLEWGARGLPGPSLSCSAQNGKTSRATAERLARTHTIGASADRPRLSQGLLRPRGRPREDPEGLGPPADHRSHGHGDAEGPHRHLQEPEAGEPEARLRGIQPPQHLVLGARARRVYRAPPAMHPPSRRGSFPRRNRSRLTWLCLCWVVADPKHRLCTSTSSARSLCGSSRSWCVPCCIAQPTMQGAGFHTTY